MVVSRPMEAAIISTISTIFMGDFAVFLPSIRFSLQNGQVDADYLCLNIRCILNSGLGAVQGQVGNTGLHAAACSTAPLQSPVSHHLLELDAGDGLDDIPWVPQRPNLFP